MSIFADRLKYLREEHGYSLRELADRCDVSKSSIHLYELGTRKPKREALEAMCCFFNVDMDYLVGKSDVKEAQLTRDEKMLLDLIKLLPDDMKNQIAQLLKCMLKNIGFNLIEHDYK